MKSVAGLIYAGGESSRFGADKATALLQGQRLIDHVNARLEPQVWALAVAGPVTLNDAACLDDGAHSGKGPLAGLFAGLTWAANLPDVTWLVTAPCDVPLLPKNLVALLTQSAADTPAVLKIDGRWQTGCTLWPTSVRATIEEILIKEEDLSLHAALKQLQADIIEARADALEGSFININTQDDLTELEQRLRHANG